MTVPLQSLPWTLTVICGPQGVRKSTIAAQLAEKYGATLHHFDDYVVDLRATTDGASYPNLHYRSTYPTMGHGHPEFVALRFRIAEELTRIASELIDSLSRQDTPVVLEGDYLMPPGAGSPPNASVTWAVIVEGDPAIVVSNLSAREPLTAPQHLRAQTSVAVGEQLALLANQSDIPVVSASPHATALARLELALHSAWSRFK